VFLDTSAIFAATQSEGGGARLICKLGEAGALSLWIGPWVLREAEAVAARKSPASRPALALLLDRARIQVAPEAEPDQLTRAQTIIAYLPDAQILAEAMAANVHYLVSLDRKHLVGNPRTALLPFPIGTPADFLAWYRLQLASRQA
jgi:predicted nucleic acid-binding protein